MQLTLNDIANIRDYIGDQPPDNELYGIAPTVTYWQEIALRVLRRRRANAAAGGTDTTSFALSGVFTVGMAKTDFASLDTAIKDLENQIAQLNGKTSGLSFAPITRRR